MPSHTRLEQLKNLTTRFGETSGKVLNLGNIINPLDPESIKRGGEAFGTALQRTGQLFGQTAVALDPTTQRLKQQTFSQNMNLFNKITQAVKQNRITPNIAKRLLSNIPQPTEEELQNPDIKQALQDALTIGLGINVVSFAAQGVADLPNILRGRTVLPKSKEVMEAPVKKPATDIQQGIQKGAEEAFKVTKQKTQELATTKAIEQTPKISEIGSKVIKELDALTSEMTSTVEGKTAMIIGKLADTGTEQVTKNLIHGMIQAAGGLDKATKTDAFVKMINSLFAQIF